MALPTTISGVILDRNIHNAGPFEYQGSFFVGVFVDSTDEQALRVEVASDPTSSFSEADSSNRPDNATGTILSYSATKKNSDIHIATIHEDTSGKDTVHIVEYHLFDMESETWTTTNETVLGGLESHDANTTAAWYLMSWVAIVARHYGELAVLYPGEPAGVMGHAYARVDIAYKADGGSSWTTGVAVDNGGEDDFYPQGAVAGPDDRVHCFLKEAEPGISGPTLYQRTMRTNETFETWPTGTSDVAIDPCQCVVPAIYDDAGTQTFVMLYTEFGAGSEFDERSYTAGDSPGDGSVTDSVSARGPIRDDPPTEEHVTRPGHLVSHGTDLHCLYIDHAGNDIYHLYDIGSGWTGDSSAIHSGTYVAVSCQVVRRGSSIYLAYFYEDTSVYYNEIDISKTYSDLDHIEFPVYNYFIGPFGT
jgi:hypothetical protein